MCIKEVAHGVGGPREVVNTVGDALDGAALEHGVGDLGVELTDPVHLAGVMRSQMAHGEHVATHGVLHVLRHQMPDNGVHFVPGEPVVTGRHRGVGGEQGGGSDALPRPATVLQFKGCKSAVAFVQVKRGELNPKQVKGLQTAHAKDVLLANSCAVRSAVQAVAQRHVLGVVALHGRVKEDHVRMLSTVADVPVSPKTQGKRSTLQLVVKDQTGVFEHVRRFEGRERLRLGAVSDVLASVTVAVQEGHGGQIKPEVGGCFDVVPRQHTQSARIGGQVGAKANFCRQVRHCGHV